MNICRRLGMRALLWILGHEKASRTCELNRVLYERISDGRSLACFSHPQVTAGDYTYGLKRESFFAYHPEDRVRIGKFCSIADGVKFIFGNHPTDTVSSFPFRAICFGGLPYEDCQSKGSIEVGNDVWIGANSLVLSGVKIGDGAIIAAGAVVSRDIPPYSIAAGVPARVLRSRFPADQAKALMEIQWWNWPLDKIEANIKLFYGSPTEFIRIFINSEQGH